MYTEVEHNFIQNCAFTQIPFCGGEIIFVELSG